MPAWTEDELARIAAAKELAIAPRRGNGTLRAPTTIWVVRVGDDAYVRSWRGPTGSWFRAAQRTHEGCISAGGIESGAEMYAELYFALVGVLDTFDFNIAIVRT
jgi:hypothetical protein